MKSQKSLLASGILDSIKKFFESAKFVGRPDKSVNMFFGHWDQVGWHTMAYQHHRNAGWNPMIQTILYVLTPTPPHWHDCWLEGCILQHPGAFLESKFIEPFAKKYLTYAAQSILTPVLDRKHLLKGLCTLILVAVCSSMFSVDIIGNNDCFFKVEGGFFAHKNGAFVAPPLFNQRNCWKPLGDFFANINKVKEERWASVLCIQGPDEDEMDSDTNAWANELMISAFCVNMYIPSSPLKEWFWTFLRSYVALHFSSHMLLFFLPSLLVFRV